MTDTYNLVQRPDTDVAEPFARMAEQIRHNKDVMFGGAIVIVPPVDGGSTVETLLLSQKDPVVFWSTAKSLVDRALETLETVQKNQNAFMRR